MKATLLGFLLIFGTSGCDREVFTGCGDTVKAEAVSPDGRYIATVSGRNCGATTDYSTNLSLRGATEIFDPSKQGPVLTVAGQLAVGLEWSTQGTLTVAVPEAETFTRLEMWRDVRIAYR